MSRPWIPGLAIAIALIAPATADARSWMAGATRAATHKAERDRAKMGAGPTDSPITVHCVRKARYRAVCNVAIRNVTQRQCQTDVMSLNPDGTEDVTLGDCWDRLSVNGPSFRIRVSE